MEARNTQCGEFRARRRPSVFIASMALLLVMSSCGGDNGASREVTEETTPEATLEASENDDDAVDSAPETEAEAEESNSGQNEAEEDESEVPDWPESNSTTMTEDTTIHEPAISPKSIVANGHGLAIANNMMYQNSVTLYDTEAQELEHELSDAISPSDFGVDGYPDTVEGAPVEAVWTEDGDYAYVSQYRLADMGAAAQDDCANGDAIAPSAVYRYSVEEQDWDQFIEVGRVPKYVALTPDESHLLVTNWCDFDLSMIDTETGEEEKRIPLNSHPRGIAAMPDNETVYVTAMYANEVWEVDLEAGEGEVIYQDGQFPRHLVLSPDAETLYVTFSHSDRLVAFDTETNDIIDSTDTGREPRTMDISEDGTALYVVNYHESTVSKFDAETLEEIDRQSTDPHPIGVTYDRMSGSVWVASYDGALNIYDDHSQER